MTAFIHRYIRKAFILMVQSLQHTHHIRILHGAIPLAPPASSPFFPLCVPFHLLGSLQM